MPDRIRRAALRVVALPILAVVRVILTVASYRAVLKLMPRGRIRIAHPAMALRIGAAVTDAARWIPGASCLTQALAAQYMLALRGYGSDIGIGVRTAAEGRVEAHAWLMSSQVIVVGGTPVEIDSYKPLTVLSRDGR